MPDASEGVYPALPETAKGRSLARNGPRLSVKLSTDCWQDPAWLSLPAGARMLYICLASAPIPRDSPASMWVRYVGGSAADVARSRAALVAAGALVDGEPAWEHLCTNRWTDGLLSRAAIPAALRRSVYERDGYRCLACGSTVDLTVDHIVPWSLGGEDTFENLRTLCRPCNSRKGARIE